MIIAQICSWKSNHDLMSLPDYSKNFAEDKILTKNRIVEKLSSDNIILEKNDNGYLFRKLIYKQPFDWFTSADLITNINIKLQSIENHNVKDLIHQINILCENELLFKYTDSYVNLDCIIPCVCINNKPFYIDIILLFDIIKCSKITIIIEYTNNYLDSSSRRTLAQNGYLISDHIGHIQNGIITKKKTKNI